MARGGYAVLVHKILSVGLAPFEARPRPVRPQDPAPRRSGTHRIGHSGGQAGFGADDHEVNAECLHELQHGLRV